MPHEPLPPDSRHARRATVAPLLLFSLTVLLAAFAFAVNKSWLWSVREELKTAADSAALAGAFGLVSDDFLRADQSLYPSLLQRASDQARAAAYGNAARGHAVTLLDNPDNLAAGDIVFGVRTLPLADDFTLISGRTAPHPDQASVNTVVISSRLTRKRGNAPGLVFGPFLGLTAADAQASSATTLDRGVRGFRPRYGSVALAPIALRSDPSAQSLTSWEYHVANGSDLFRFDPATNQFVNDPSGDRIREFPVSYATESNQLADANAALINLSTPDLAVAAQQLIQGISAADLTDSGGQLVLPDSGTLAIAGRQVGPTATSGEIAGIAQSLQSLRASGAVRIWPLYTSFDDGASAAQVSGFVAARVVELTPPQDQMPLRFTLQATVLSCPQAVTDTELRGPAATMNQNPYIVKLRRIE